MTTKQWNQSVTDSIKNLVAHNKSKQGEEIDIRQTETPYPTSFSAWLERNGDSIEDIGGNVIPDRIAANHDIYKNGNPFQ